VRRIAACPAPPTWPSRRRSPRLRSQLPLNHWPYLLATGLVPWLFPAAAGQDEPRPGLVASGGCCPVLAGALPWESSSLRQQKCTWRVPIANGDTSSPRRAANQVLPWFQYDELFHMYPSVITSEGSENGGDGFRLAKPRQQERLEATRLSRVLVTLPRPLL